MTWTPYELDRIALKIVLDAKDREQKELDGKKRKDQPKEIGTSDPNKMERRLGSLNQV